MEKLNLLNEWLQGLHEGLNSGSCDLDAENQSELNGKLQLIELISAKIKELEK